MIGATLGGRYELLARVGGGGMALVYKARDILLNRYVAVKVLRQQFMHDEDFVKRFRREAQAAASLSHPNIVSIYDVGQDDDTHYIVMEYIEGVNLNEMIRERAPLQVEEAVRIAAQICDALDHAHHNQIIHRDIKPHNILIGNNGRIKVTDFGIARAVTSSTITQTGSVVGSVHYFSPEHAKGVATGEKSDIYSLGIVLYQMLTGQLPFLGESPISVALKHLQDTFERPRSVNKHIPQSVENIIVRAMRKNPQERYASAKAMLGDLETCLRPERLNEPRIEFASDEDETAERTRVIPAIRHDMVNTLEAPSVRTETSAERKPDADAAEEDEEDRPRRRWVLPTVLSALAVVLIGVLVWGVLALMSQLRPSDVPVPDVIGMEEQLAVAALEEAGLGVQTPTIYMPDEAKAGTVIKQSKQNMEVKEGSLIQLTVSEGPELPKMPQLTGKPFEEAKNELIGMGVDPANIGQNPVHDDSEAGTVLKQFPEEGAEFDPAKDGVTLTVSKGPETVPMPDLIDKSEDEARALVEKANLKLPDVNVKREPSYSPQGKVFKQFPAEKDQPIAPGTEVTIWVSSGYPADSKTRPFKVTVSPAEEGKESTVRIVISDATGDNKVWEERKITTTTEFQVTLIVSPSKNGLITIIRDGQFEESYPVLYADDIPASTTESPPPVESPDGEPPADGGEPPEGEQGAADGEQDGGQEGAP